MTERFRRNVRVGAALLAGILLCMAATESGMVAGQAPLQTKKDSQAPVKAPAPAVQLKVSFQSRTITTAEMAATGLRPPFQPRNVTALGMTATGLRLPFQPRNVTALEMTATGLRQ